MASSGVISINAQSVDNGTVGAGMVSTCGAMPSGTCYTTGNAWAFGRGHVTNNVIFNYSVNDSGLFSVSYRGVTGPNWYVCATAGYYIDVDFSTDNANWTNIMHSHVSNWPCPPSITSHYLVSNIANTVAAGLTPVVLTQSGYVRMRMWTPQACPTCNGISGSDVWPNAFPNDAASIATAVPVYIDVAWTARINYNANGGTGGPGSQSASENGDTHSFVVPNQSPTYNDYKFLGWSRAQHTGTCTVADVDYRAGDTIVINKNSPTLTLYACWEKDYRPGQILDNNSVWQSHNRSSGADNIRTESNWKTMRTIDGPSATGDPPVIHHASEFKNQRKIGANK